MQKSGYVSPHSPHFCHDGAPCGAVLHIPQAISVLPPQIKPAMAPGVAFPAYRRVHLSMVGIPEAQDLACFLRNDLQTIGYQDAKLQLLGS